MPKSPIPAAGGSVPPPKLHNNDRKTDEEVAVDVQALEKLVGLYDQLGTGERIALLAAVRCLDCDHYASCGRGQELLSQLKDAAR